MVTTISFGEFYYWRNAGENQMDFALANRRAVQGELNRLAGELYDELTQHLSAIRLQLVVAKELISSTRGNPLGNIQRAIELANLGLTETRRCVHNLRRGVVDESGLREALQGLAERLAVPSRLRCDFRSANVPEDRLSDASRTSVVGDSSRCNP